MYGKSNMETNIAAAAVATAKSLQLCPTLCDPIGGSLLGFSVHGILQARLLECVAIAFSRNLYYLFKIDSHQEFAVWLRKLKQGLCINLEGVGWEGRWEGGSKRRGYMYTCG